MSPLFMSSPGSSISSDEVALRRWFTSQQGTLLLKLERREYARLAPRLFGYHLLQLGPLGDNLEHLAASPIRNKCLLSGSVFAATCAAAELSMLPVQTDSIDAMVLPHTLDTSVDPLAVLREVERVLIPEGRVLLSCFNPWSLWGVRRVFSRRKIPWSGHFISYPNLHDWLTLLGFRVEETQVLMFRPPLANRGVQRRLRWMDRLGGRFWPMLAGVYLVSAVKQVSRVTPVQPRWRRARLVAGRALEPSARGMNRENDDG